MSVSSAGTGELVVDRRPAVAAKAILAARTVKRVRNWPQVLTGYGRARAGSAVDAELAFAFRDGTRLTCRADVLSSSPVFEVLIDDTYRLDVLRRALPGEAVGLVDVGAHVGGATLALARALPLRGIVCAEPSPTSAALLRRNLAANGVAATVVEAAVGGTDGSAVLEEGSPGSCENRVRSPGRPAGDATSPAGRVVPVVALAGLLGRLGPGPVVVKMDCEGGEYPILDGTPAEAWAPVSALLLEYHPVEGTGGWPRLAERFAGLGLWPLWHRPDPLRPGLGTACLLRRG